MRTTLHIGSTKTGSTSIQDMLAANRDLLAQHRVLYPASLGATTHNVIPIYAGGTFRHSELHRKVGVFSREDYKTFTQTSPAAFRAEVEAAGAEHIIISSEHMQSRLYKPAHFTRLRTLLEPDRARSADRGLSAAPDRTSDLALFNHAAPWLCRHRG